MPSECRHIVLCYGYKNFDLLCWRIVHSQYRFQLRHMMRVLFFVLVFRQSCCWMCQMSEHFSGFEIRYISLLHLFVCATAGAIITAQQINADKNFLYELNLLLRLWQVTHPHTINIVQIYALSSYVMIPRQKNLSCDIV